MKKLGYFLLTLLILCAAPAIAQDQKEAPAKKSKTKKPAVKPQVKAEKKEEPKMDVVVTASKFEKPTEEIAKSVEVSKKKEIEAKGEQSLAEVAADQPGVITTRSGGEGGGTGIYIRGGNTDQVLVLVDGIEANEPMSYGRGSDPDVLAMPGVDQVEILEGPASALYGSDAEAGVINIITRRPPNGLAASLFFEGGSYQTFKEVARASVGSPNYFADFTAGRFDTGGISSADIKNGNSEHDGYHNTSLALRVGAKPADWLEVEAVIHAIYSQTDLDTVNLTSGLPEDDPNYTFNSTTYLSAVRAKIYTGNFTQKVEFSYSDFYRTYLDKPDDRHPLDSYTGYYRSDLRKLGWQGEYRPDATDTLIFGLEYQDETGNSRDKGTSSYGPYEDDFSDKSIVNHSVYTAWDYHTKKYGFLLGGRADNNDAFGNHGTGEFSGYLQPWEKGPRLHAAIGTGFKAPSLYQLYGNVGGFVVGNKDLKPEQSESEEVGIEQGLLDGRVIMSATYFNVLYKDLINFDSLTYGYNNVAEAKAPGWEAALKLKPVPTLDLKASYLFVDARDEKTNDKLIRRWGEKYTFGLDWRPVKRVEASVWGVHRGMTDDEIFPLYGAKIVHLKPYTVVNLNVRWKIVDSLAADFRVDNLFNEKYEEVYGYGTMPQTFYAGLSYNVNSGGK